MGLQGIAGKLGRRTMARDLALGLTLVIVSVMLAVGSFIFFSSASDAASDLDRRAGELADKLAEVLSVPLWTLDTRSIEQIAGAYLDTEDIVALRIVDDAGEVIYLVASDEENLLVEERTVLYNGREMGLVEISLSRASVRAAQKEVLVFTLIAMLAVVAAALAAMRILLWRLLDRPLAELRQGIDAIARGDYRQPMAPLRQADINEIVQKVNDMADQIAARDEALRERGEFLRTITESSQDMIVIVGEDGNIGYASPAVESVLGYAPEELVGRSGYQLITRDDSARASRNLDTLAGTGGLYGDTYRIVRKDGSVAFIETRTTDMLHNPYVKGLVINGRDVTWRIRAEQELREANEQLRDFLTVAAHELRHPINLVRGYVSTLEQYREELDCDTLEEVYRGVELASGRLVRLVEELLEVSRIQQERFRVERREGSPGDILCQAVEEMRARGIACPVEVRAARGPEAWPLDADKFHQLAVILLENAASYSPEGSPIELEVEDAEGGLLLSVLDRGCGVAESDREKIFDRFYQVEDPSHHSVPGLGMGLYIAREIVRGHGGRIWHEPRPGGGSVFRVVIPPPPA